MVSFFQTGVHIRSGFNQCFDKDRIALSVLHRLHQRRCSQIRITGVCVCSLYDQCFKNSLIFIQYFQHKRCHPPVIANIHIRARFD